MSREKPHVIFFFMNGCPHCERTWPAWDKAKPKLIGMATVEAQESKEVSPDDGVSSFPTFTVRMGDREIKRIEGARENPTVLIKELGLRRRRTFRNRRPIRTRRALRKRALRNNKSF
jgi:glutaredoxin